MAEVPEEVVVTIEADDRATPKLSTVGRNLVLLGANIAYVTRELGIQNPVIDQTVKMILIMGHIARAAAAAKTLLAAATTAYTGTAAAATAANYGLAASFRALWASMGPLGLVLLGIGLLAGGIAGYALAGGFSPKAGGGVAAVGGGPYQEPMVQINVNVDKMSTKRDVEETVKDMATLWHQQTRRYK